jgi:hypothetical protein
VNNLNKVRSLIYAGLLLAAFTSIMACTSILPTSAVVKPAAPPAAGNTQQPAQVPAVEAPSNEAGWATVKSFTGTEDTTTPAFTISGSKWRIIWSVDTQQPQYAVFDVMVYRQDSSNILVARISYSSGTTSNTVIIDEGGHNYHLKIISANLNKWTVDTEEYSSQSSSQNQAVQITEVRYKGMSYDESLSQNHSVVEWDEYVEIKNFSDSPQDIAGWKLKNITKGAPTFIFPMSKPCSCEYLGTWSKCVQECYPKRPCAIDPHSKIRVYTGEPQWDSGGYCFYSETGNIWDNNTPDIAVLYNAQGQEVSRRSYIIPGQRY